MGWIEIGHRRCQLPIGNERGPGFDQLVFEFGIRVIDNRPGRVLCGTDPRIDIIWIDFSSSSIGFASSGRIRYCRSRGFALSRLGEGDARLGLTSGPLCEGGARLGFTLGLLCEGGARLGFTSGLLCEGGARLGFTSGLLCEGGARLGFTSGPLCEGGAILGFALSRCGESSARLGFTSRPLSDGRPIFGLATSFFRRCNLLFRLTSRTLKSILKRREFSFQLLNPDLCRCLCCSGRLCAHPIRIDLVFRIPKGSLKTLHFLRRALGLIADACVGTRSAHDFLHYGRKQNTGQQVKEWRKLREKAFSRLIWIARRQGKVSVFINYANGVITNRKPFIDQHGSQKPSPAKKPRESIKTLCEGSNRKYANAIHVESLLSEAGEFRIGKGRRTSDAARKALLENWKILLDQPEPGRPVLLTVAKVFESLQWKPSHIGKKGFKNVDGKVKIGKEGHRYGSMSGEDERKDKRE